MRFAILAAANTETVREDALGRQHGVPSRIEVQKENTCFLASRTLEPIDERRQSICAGNVVSGSRRTNKIGGSMSLAKLFVNGLHLTASLFDGREPKNKTEYLA